MAFRPFAKQIRQRNASKLSQVDFLTPRHRHILNDPKQKRREKKINVMRDERLLCSEAKAGIRNGSCNRI